MKAIVLYTSKTGFTKRYAQEIASRLQCEAQPAAAVSAETLKTYDTVIYGGWIFASKIKGLAKVRPLVRGRLIVFAVGATPTDQQSLTALRDGNQLGDTPLFYLEGGFHFEKLGFMTRFMLKTISKMAAKNDAKNPQDAMPQNMVGASFDHTDLNTVEPIVAAARA